MSPELVFLFRLALSAAALVGLELLLARREKKRAKAAAKVFRWVGR